MNVPVMYEWSYIYKRLGNRLWKQLMNNAKSVERQDSKLALSQHQEQSGHRWNSNPIIDMIKVLDKELRDLHNLHSI